MTDAAPDDTTLIETLAGVVPGSPVAAAYARRADARAQSELSYHLLIRPSEAGAVSLRERLAVAAFVAGLYGEPATLRHYIGLLDAEAAALATTIAASARAAATSGPFGHFPPGALTAEDIDGVAWVPSAAEAALYGARLAAALSHAHMLCLHPRDAKPEALAVLFAAGWDEDGIVVLSQFVSFISFQIRVVAGLSALVTRQAA